MPNMQTQTEALKLVEILENAYWGLTDVENAYWQLKDLYAQAGDSRTWRMLIGHNEREGEDMDDRIASIISAMDEYFA